MKPVLILVLFAALLTGCASAPSPVREGPATSPGPSRPDPDPVTPDSCLDLSVAEAVAVAVERNPDLGIAAARILAAESAVMEARSAWYPRVGLALGYTHTNDPVLVFMSKLRQRDLSFGGDFNQPGDRGNARLSAEVSWLVWDGGRRQAGEDMARQAIRIEEAARDAVLNEMKAAVIGVSLAAYESDEFIKVAEDSVKLVEQQLLIAKSRFDAGAAQRSDVLQVEVRLASARESRVRAKNAKDRAVATLRALMGLSEREPFSLRPAGAFRVPPVEAEQYFETALANRPELRRAAEAVAAAELAVTSAEAGGMPTVAAFGSYDLDDRYGGFTPKQDSALAGVRVEYEVFDGGLTRSRIETARLRVREAREMSRKTEIVIERDVSTASLDLDEARERVRVTEKSEELAVEALNLIRSRYETGAATITEYLDAEVALTEARVRKVAARFDEERATADLRRALGICRAGAGGEVVR